MKDILILILSALLLSPWASAVTLTPVPEKTLTFSAGRDLQPVSFSPDGSKLLTVDAAGLTLWQPDTLRPLWRSPAQLKWFPSSASWDQGKITLSGTTGQEVQLSVETGQQVAQGQRHTPVAVEHILGPQHSKVRQLAQGIWQDDPNQPIPFEIMPGKLTAFYAQHDPWLALKRPGNAPLELWSGGRLQRRLDTIFPARGTAGVDTRFTENLSFSPGGHWLAWSANRRVTLWDVHSGHKVAVLRPDPYTQDDDNLQVVWATERSLLVYSMRAVWHYAMDGGNAFKGNTFKLLSTTPVPGGALIRMVSSTGTVASGTAAALLLSKVDCPPETFQVLGPVPQRVFFAQDGKTVMVLA